MFDYLIFIYFKIYLKMKEFNDTYKCETEFLTLVFLKIYVETGWKTIQN